ncbi:DUF3307 domain-containing protein [Patescibacteria group bacterium]
MEDLFARVVLGHLVADYLFQNNWMALHKSKPGLEGFKRCIVHCTIYATCINLFMWSLSPVVFLVAFLSHYPIDRYSLAQKWLDFIGGRNSMNSYNSNKDYKEIQISFDCIVYTMADNTMHIVILWLALKFI